jgi:hypothetical protein
MGIKAIGIPVFNLSATGADGICGASVIWFDYELGEKEFYKCFVCDEHRVRNRVEKLAQPQTATSIV